MSSYANLNLMDWISDLGPAMKRCGAKEGSAVGVTYPDEVDMEMPDVRTSKRKNGCGFDASWMTGKQRVRLEALGIDIEGLDDLSFDEAMAAIERKERVREIERMEVELAKKKAHEEEEEKRFEHLKNASERDILIEIYKLLANQRPIHKPSFVDLSSVRVDKA